MDMDMCRACLRKGLMPLSHIYTDDKCPNSPSTMIMECTTVKLCIEDGLPTFICQECLNSLRAAFHFKRQCEASDYQLRKISLHNHHTNTSAAPETTVKNEVKTVPENQAIGILDHESQKFDDKKFSRKDSEMKNKQSEEIIISTRKPSRTKVKKGKLKVPEKCYECGKIFRYTGYLETHLRTHTGEKPFVCKICQKAFAQIGNLVSHTRTHTGEKPYQCEICSKQFSTLSNLTSHREIHSDNQRYECTQCNKTFKTWKLLQSHSGTHTGEKNHVCKMCGKSFYKTSYLNGHINTIHNKEKKHKCSECGKHFSNMSNLTAHFRIHTGEKPFVCTVCSVRFNQSSALQRHKQIHTNSVTKKNRKQSQITLQNDTQILFHKIKMEYGESGYQE